MSDSTTQWLAEIKFDADGLIPAIAQNADDDSILMVAWMNEDSLKLTIDTGYAVYWSRSRQKLWRKGEESGHQQLIKEVRLDCDGDVLILKVEQLAGIACHTGRANCFYRVLRDGQWHITHPILKDPEEIYNDK